MNIVSPLRLHGHQRCPAVECVFRCCRSELDDLAHQAAADALLAITDKLGQFRGESRFTTWANKFVIFEVSAKIGRHFWQRPTVPMEAEDWDRLPDRFGMGPAGHAQWHPCPDNRRTPQVRSRDFPMLTL